MSTADGGLAVTWDDNGTADHRWRLRYTTDGHFRIQCGNGGRVLSAAMTPGVQIVLRDDNGTNDQRWRFV